MKTVYLIGFRGLGFSALAASEPALIRAGHVGIAFEGQKHVIYGFHPTPQEADRFGSETELLQYLLDGNQVSGSLQVDTEIFVRAAQLAELNPRVSVWETSIDLSDDAFENVRQQALEWYNAQTSFVYAFPENEQEMQPDRDNCATFPRRLGLPIPELTGQLRRYIPQLAAISRPWSS